MPQTNTKSSAEQEADATEQWLNSLDPARLDFRDATHVRAIIAAAEAREAADESLRRAVADARANGDSWTVIGAALGISKQAAYERFHAHVVR